MRISILILIIPLLVSCGVEETEFSTASFSITLNGEGRLTGLHDTRTGRDYLPPGQAVPFITLRTGGVIHSPNTMERAPGGREMIFRFDTAGVTVALKAEKKPSHLYFEVVDVEAAEKVELIIWGPYPTIIGKVIGETVGVVQGEDFAIGLQALNPKTLGGYPWTGNDCMPQLDIFEGDDYSDLSEEGKRYVLYRVEAAKPEDFGSTLQAYCRNRNEPRTIENWGHDRYLAPPIDDGGIIGSKIALFGCPVEEVLDHIEQVELAEGLPHPMVAGEWGKRSQQASSSYMILGFGEDDIDRALEYTRKAGLSYLYHPGPFKTWGHFPLNGQFPNGWDGLKACVDRAGQQGIFLGVHTLSNFITPDDAYVTPVPDDRLAKAGYTTLTGSIGPIEDEIPVADPALFQPAKSISMRTVRIGQELIQYARVSKSEPWSLLGCERGAFGTSPAPHEDGAEVALLADHAYNVFLSDAALTIEIGEAIARLFNETGIRQVSFDGLEGNRSTGMGNYGEILMTNSWYEALDEDVKTHYIADASRTSHFFWHIYTRMNWGEPWYDGFRESQAEYRFKNQEYFRRNLMPGMLGWFLLTEKTSLNDIEWMLSKAAGYNAGFGFVCSYKSLEGNGRADEILALISRWENARMQQLFTPEMMEMLRSAGPEYHLDKTPGGHLTLWTSHVVRMEYPLAECQPGETAWTSVDFANAWGDQPIQFTATVPENTGIGSFELAIDNNTVFTLPGGLEPGSILQYGGQGEIRIYSSQWSLRQTIPAAPATFMISGGEHTLAVKAQGAGVSEAPLKIEFKNRGNPQNIPAL